MRVGLADLVAAAQKCIGCGACTVACPLFVLDRREELGPRGKIRILRAAHTWGVPGPEALGRYTRMCLLCGRCVQACPNAVAPAHILRRLRGVLASLGVVHPAAAAVARAMANQPRAAALMKVGRLVLPATSGLVLRLWGARLPVPAARAFLADGAAATAGKGPRVALFIGCGANFLWPELARAAVSALGRKWEVVVPRTQGCCGLAAASAGLEDLARTLARAGTELLVSTGAELVVTPCASCAYAMSELWPALYPPAEELAPRVREISQLLPELGVQPPGQQPPFALHQPCHHPPGPALSSLLEEAGLHPRAASDGCCGGGGLMGLSNPALSRKVLLSNSLARGHHELLVTTCTGCRVQLGAGLGARVVHPLELMMIQPGTAAG